MIHERIWEALKKTWYGHDPEVNAPCETPRPDLWEGNEWRFKVTGERFITLWLVDDAATHMPVWILDAFNKTYEEDGYPFRYTRYECSRLSANCDRWNRVLDILGV